MLLIGTWLLGPPGHKGIPLFVDRAQQCRASERYSFQQFLRSHPRRPGGVACCAVHPIDICIPAQGGSYEVFRHRLDSLLGIPRLARIKGT